MEVSEILVFLEEFWRLLLSKNKYNIYNNLLENQIQLLYE